MPTIRCSVLVTALCFLVPLTSSLIAQEPAKDIKDTGSKDLRKLLLGAWALAGTPESKDDPEPGARMKFWGLKHWCITETDPETGELEYHHGGTYTLDGDKYTETITFAAESTKSMIGMTFKFKIKVDRDTYIQIGNGNPFNERWVRLKQE